MPKKKQEPKSFEFNPEDGHRTVLYNGEVELVFDDSDFKHVYRANGREVPSVTTILSAVSKPDLTTWSAKMGAERFKELVTPGEVLDEVSIQNVATEIQWAHKNFLKTAGTIGDIAHKFAEHFIAWKLGKGDRPELPFNKPAQRASKAFLSWVKDNDIAFKGSEFRVYSRKYHYAGTVDIDAVVAGERCIVDLKTAKGVYKEHLLQVAAYMQALEEENPGTKYDAAWIVKIDKRTARCKSLRIPRDALEDMAGIFAYLGGAADGLRKADKHLRSIEKAYKEAERLAA